MPTLTEKPAANTKVRSVPAWIQEQRDVLPPEHIDYISIQEADKAERTVKLVARLTEDAESIYRTESRQWLEVRSSDFQNAKEARQWAKEYYPGITVQRD